jgi:branched-chain amino acid transport system permease protein
MNTALRLLIDTLSTGGIFALFSLGVALIFSVMGLINFAYAALIMVTGYMLLYLGGLTAAGAIVLAVLIAMALAVLTERIAFRPIRSGSQVTLLVSSFAVYYFIEYFVLSLVGGLPRSVNVLGFANHAVSVGSDQVSVLSLVTIGVTIVLVVALAAFLNRTQFGLQIRAAAEDFGMARLLGVRADAVIAGAFAISGFLAGVAGVLYVAQQGTLTVDMGFSPVLYAFVATIIGGLGSLKGAVIGGLILGLLVSIFQDELPLGVAPFRDAFVFGAVILLLVLLPNGLFGVRERGA